GQELWLEERAAWRRNRAEDTPNSDGQSVASSNTSRSSLPLGGNSASPLETELSEADRLNLRSCLAATAGPYPPLRRRYPLRVAIQAAVQIWEVESPLLSEKGSPITRLATAARDSTQDFLVRTAAAGSNFVSWSSGLLGSAAKALESHCRPQSMGDRKDKTLVDSLRNRGGIVVEQPQ
ncbi:unnamed protein product, partial [Cladocopium goreaui]